MSGTVERTQRWRGLVGATLVAAAVGVVTSAPGLLLLAGVGALLVAYGTATAPPPATLAVERRLDPPDPDRGEAVAVETTVTNVGERTLFDVRLADGVPGGVRVEEGCPRRGTRLAPGASATLEYRVRGEGRRHAFEGVAVECRDVAGVVRRRTTVEAGDDVGWPGRIDAPPVDPRLLVPGRVATDEGGAGLAFHAVREHRTGDPIARIDWKRRARTGQLATVEYRRERAGSVVVLVDTRPAARLRPGPDEPTAIDRSLAAAGRLAEGLWDGGHRVGVAALDPPTVLAPGDGPAHRRRVYDRLAALEGDGEGVPDGGAGRARADGGDARTTDDRVDGVLARLPAKAQVVVCTPLCDAESATVVERLRAHGHPVSVCSPDPTGDATIGERVARLERGQRVRRLRRGGVGVLDWPWSQSLDRALAGGWDG